MGLILVIILVCLILGAFGGGYSGAFPMHYGFYGGGGIGLILLIVVIFLLVGR